MEKAIQYPVEYRNSKDLEKALDACPTIRGKLPNDRLLIGIVAYIGDMVDFVFETGPHFQVTVSDTIASFHDLGRVTPDIYYKLDPIVDKVRNELSIIVTGNFRNAEQIHQE